MNSWWLHSTNKQRFLFSLVSFFSKVEFENQGFRKKITYFMVMLTPRDGRSTSVSIDNVTSETCAIDLTLNWLFIAQNQRHEQATSIQFLHSAPAYFKMI